MGNQTGRESHATTGSPLDFYQTPPTTPSEADLAAMALSSASSSSKTQTPSPAGGTTPSTSSPLAEWTQKLSAPSEWAVISVDSISSQTNVSDAAVRQHGGAAGSPTSLPPSRGSPSEHSWQERDSGVEPQAAAERSEEMTLVLLSLMEHYRASMGLTPNTDVTTGAVELLRCLIMERDELVEEVDQLRETLRTERLEWHQFQSDLQVAVSVADRLRVESDQALSEVQERHRAVEQQLDQALSRQQERDRAVEQQLDQALSRQQERHRAVEQQLDQALSEVQERHRAVEQQLDQALSRQQERDTELETLKVQHQDVCSKLSEVSLLREHERAELDALRKACREKDMTNCDKQRKRQDSEVGQREDIQRVVVEKPRDVEADTEVNIFEKPKEQTDASQEAEDQGDSEEADGSGSTALKGKRVAEGYLRSLAVLEMKKDPRRIVMLSERSWSLSRLPVPTDSSRDNGTSKETSTTLPLCKREEPPKPRRTDRILQRQDSWSSFYTGKQDEDQSTDYIKPQDGFSALLRRHGGSRRNSLLRWCQSRTQGYKNVEITNFSSSWEDGLVFCAVYHTYLPTHIQYDTLDPAHKKENLDLAFKTGESLGITATLSVEEMLKADGPDWQRVLGYVESIFRHFEM